MRIDNRALRLLIIISVFMVFVFSVHAGDVEKININKASVEELMQLKRIGRKIAGRILEYREKNGAFERPEDIMKVKGIGSKIFESNRESISIE